MNGRRARELRRQAPLLAGKRPVGLLEYLSRPTRGYGEDDVAVGRQIVSRSGILSRIPQRSPSTPGPKPKSVTAEGVLTGLALAKAEAVLASHQETPDLSPDAVRAVLMGGEALPRMLAVATPDERRRIYDAAGITLRYKRSDDGQESVRVTLSVGFFCVGEGT